MNRILIYYPKNFKVEGFFVDKVSTLISGLEDCEIVVLNDYNGFVISNFSIKYSVKNITEDHNYKYNVNKELKTITHAIVFWDGRGIEWLVYSLFLMKISNRIIAVEVTEVANKDVGDKYDVYIGRGTPWGNPFPIGEDGMSREDVINKYRLYFEKEILTDPIKRKNILSLKGKILGCHCKPLPCHGDVIAEYLNTFKGDDD
ncbi:DUF4326 domain-containing protein [Iodobacter fluviatilis]|nr:DUF4326 domain-containing protein [Iodobacter fluviatilis]